jgi:hypothetical protein
MTLEEKILATKIWTIRVGVAIICFVFFYVMMVSTIPAVPVKVISTVLSIRQDPGSDFRVIEEQREYLGYTEIDVTSSYTLYSENAPNLSYILHGMSFETRLGQFTTYNTIIIPNGLTGRWCLQVTHSWWPTFSQRTFVMPVADTCFEIK